MRPTDGVTSSVAVRWFSTNRKITVELRSDRAARNIGLTAYTLCGRALNFPQFLYDYIVE